MCALVCEVFGCDVILCCWDDPDFICDVSRRSSQFTKSGKSCACTAGGYSVIIWLALGNLILENVGSACWEVREIAFVTRVTDGRNASFEYCANGRIDKRISKRLKPPQKTVGFFWD